MPFLPPSQQHQSTEGKKDEEEAEEISTYTNVIDRCIRSYS